MALCLCVVLVLGLEPMLRGAVDKDAMDFCVLRETVGKETIGFNVQGDMQRSHYIYNAQGDCRHMNHGIHYGQGGRRQSSHACHYDLGYASKETN